MTTTLYDVRMYRESRKRYLHLSDPRGAYVATTNAVMGALRDGPDMVAVRAALPANLRKAFDRAGSFWFDKYNDAKHGHMTLYTMRGALIGTLYAIRKDV